MKLIEFAIARSGDKGNDANVAVIARKKEFYPLLLSWLTEASIKTYFARLKPTKVIRYEMPVLLALNFHLVDVLGGGASFSLRCDTQGKTLGTALLAMEVPDA